jgi:hypothetical protein
VAYESKAEPIRLGYLFDFRLPPGCPQENAGGPDPAFPGAGYLVARRLDPDGVSARPVGRFGQE